MAQLSEAETQLLNSFWVVYQPALNALASDPQTACEVMGNDNAPLAIQRELAGADALAHAAALALDEEQRGGMLQLAKDLKRLPQDALAPAGALMTSHAGCVQAMRHPAWAPLRQQAVRLAELLEPVFDRIEDYFYPD